MNVDEKNRIITLTKNINNIAQLIEELLIGVDELMKKNSCTRQEACNIKIKAEEFLKKYGKFTLESTNKALLSLTK